MRQHHLALVFASLLLSFTGAMVQARDADPSTPRVGTIAIAQELFESGRALMAAGKFSEACGKLEESHRLDPASGTLLNLAVCHETQGKVATAWAEYGDVVSAARREGNLERQRIAGERFQRIGPTLPRARLVPAAIDDRPELVVKLDGVELRAAALDAAIPVDGGVHRIEVLRPHKRAWAGMFGPIATGTTETIRIPALFDEVLPAEAAAKSERAPPNLRQRIAYALGGTALVALGTGGYFGYLAKSEWDLRNGLCVPNCNNGAVVQAERRASRLARFADGSVALAAVSAGLATYLYLTASPPAPRTGPRDVALAVQPLFAPEDRMLALTCRGRF